MYRNTEYTRIKAPAGRYVYSKHGRTNPKPQRGGMFIEHRQTNFPSPKYPVGCPSILGSLSLAPYITFWVFRHVPHRIDARYIEKVTRPASLIVGEFGYLLVSIEYGNSTYALYSDLR